MPPRFPLNGATGGQEGAQKIIDTTNRLYDSDFKFPIRKGHGEDETLLSFYAPLSHGGLPMTEKFFEAAKALQHPDVVPPRYRELAILGLISVIEVPYVQQLHKDFIAAKYGFTSEQYEQAVAGQTPGGLSEPEEMAYRLGRKLTLITEPLDEATFKEALENMSKAEIVGIVHSVAAYRWISMLHYVNGDQSLP